MKHYHRRLATIIAARFQRATISTMPTKEDLLREKTFKEDGVELTSRVFYTLQTDKNVQADRNSRAIALIVDHLHKKKLISDAEIDELLFDSIG